MLRIYIGFSNVSVIYASAFYVRFGTCFSLSEAHNLDLKNIKKSLLSHSRRVPESRSHFDHLLCSFLFVSDSRNDHQNQQKITLNSGPPPDTHRPTLCAAGRLLLTTPGARDPGSAYIGRYMSKYVQTCPTTAYHRRNANCELCAYAARRHIVLSV